MKNNAEKYDKTKYWLSLIARIIVFILAMSASVYSATSLVIDEVMYNPDGTDAGREYIKIVEENCSMSYVLDELKLYENGVNHELVFNDSLLQLCGSYFIVDDADAFSAYYNISGQVVAESSFSLGNTGEYIAIKYFSEIVDEIDYSNYLNSSGFWKRIVPNETIEGAEDLTQNSTQNMSDIPANASANISTNTSVNASANISANISANSSVFQGNSSAQNNDSASSNSSINNSNNCDVFLTLFSYDAFDTDKITFYNIISNYSHDFEIEYWIENLAGEIVKAKIKTTNLNQKSWTSGTEQVYVIKNNLTFISCNNSANKTSDERMIIIKANKAAALQDSSQDTAKKSSSASSSSGSFSSSSSSAITGAIAARVEESNITFASFENEIRPNESFDISLIIYKGNTAKYTIKVWVENGSKRVSEISKVNIYQKYSVNELTIPVMINSFDQCSMQNLQVVVEGLGIIARAGAEADYSSCASQFKEGKVAVESPGQAAPASSPLKALQKQTESNLNNASVENTEKEEGIIYESPLKKAGKYVNFAIAGLFILLMAILWGKGKNGAKENKGKDRGRVAAHKDCSGDTGKAEGARGENPEGLCEENKGDRKGVHGNKRIFFRAKGAGRSRRAFFHFRRAGNAGEKS